MHRIENCPSTNVPLLPEIVKTAAAPIAATSGPYGRSVRWAKTAMRTRAAIDRNQTTCRPCSRPHGSKNAAIIGNAYGG